ncbi:MAG: flagellar motor protein MotB [Pseudomonadota bacterium]
MDEDDDFAAAESRPPSKEWMITLADLLSLLMVFFVMLHVIILTQNNEKVDDMVKSLNKELHTPTLQIVSPYIQAYTIRNFRPDSPPESIFYWYNFFKYFLESYGHRYSVEIKGVNLVIHMPADDFEEYLEADELDELTQKIANLIGQNDFRAEIIRYLYVLDDKIEYGAKMNELLRRNTDTVKMYYHKFRDYPLINNIVEITPDIEKAYQISFRFFEIDGDDHLKPN